ncbi:hypothetical protein LAZ67_19002218 [Cordylochernes scorpioides]|uniref:Reverse transcriptase n=1 Tax=Cordylochernes scorpioides TaxID=51811 RepID=A0ABY6LIC2_9ARAC|nr:hypothetical protein LAZ67_19002218 [Cordylochernes scorpioides]
MERIILRRLTYHLNTRNLLPEDQYGFRKGHGTIDQLLFFTQKPGREEKAVPIFGTLLDQKMEREEALERLKKKRTILRTSLSKYGKRIEEYDVHKECDHEELLGQLSDV